jgi:diguanylate cyclase (GGDEF)-like protein/PAS domain S-box-containing protein
MPILNSSDLHPNITLLEAVNKELENEIKLLNAKKESLKLAQEVGHFGSWEIDLTTHKSIWSEQSYRIYKLDPNTTSPTLETFTSRVVEEDREKLAQGMASLSDGKIKTLTLRVRREDGVIITILINAKYIFNDVGVPVKMTGTTLDITELSNLKQENEELVSIIEHSSNEIYIVDIETYQYLYANEQALNNLGYTRDEMYQMKLFDINKSLTLSHAKKLKTKLTEKGTLFNKSIHTKKNGETYPVQSYLQHRHYQGCEVGIVFSIDITERLKAEEKQRQQAQILEQIHDAVISTDLEGIITHWNHGAYTIHGYSADEIIGQHILTIYPQNEHQKMQWIQKQALRYGVHKDQITKLTKNGSLIHTNITASALKNDAGEVIGITRYSQDITHKKEMEDKLKSQTKLLNFQAYHDALTKLPNRALFDDRLQQSINHAHRHNERFALFFIDLDNFKQINDTLGHPYGDKILKIVAKRLSKCILNEDTLSRVGGDEFTLLRQNLETSESAAKVAEKIIQVLKQKIVLDGHTLHITASIGISLYPKDSILKNDLLKYADTAMYKAKDEGRDNYQFYSSEMTRLAFEKAVMESALHRAIDEKQFVVYYQPQIDLRDNSIVGVEALIRWNHPEMGLILPDKFISLAEESSFIQELDNYVMSQAMADIQELYAKGLNPGVLSLNLSIKQLMNDHFLQTLSDTISRTKFDVQWLEFEITESQMMLDPMKSIEILQTISEMGIKIAIDDFGTGYSSLAYLKKLPVNKLKIDQSFIQDLPEDEEDAAITKAVIALAKSLKLSLIAEGVEKHEQIEYLMKHECYLIQGYYYSKALSKTDITNYIQNNVIMPLDAL